MVATNVVAASMVDQHVNFTQRGRVTVTGAERAVVVVDI